MRTRLNLLAALAAVALLLFGADYAFAHCDGLDGPVVKAAQRALESGNVNFALIWVREADEAELKTVFRQTLAVRKMNADSKALADRHFFETLVRLHRGGEGAPYTGLKPAGRDLGPAIPAADRALETGNAAALEAMLVEDLRRELAHVFSGVQAKQKYAVDDVAAGRDFVKAYVEYVHYVERLHEAIANPAAGHFAEAER